MSVVASYIFVLSFLVSSFLPLIFLPTSYAEDISYVELDPIVVTANRVKEFLSETPSSVAIITSRDIKFEQAITLDEALRDITGIRVLSFGGADPMASVNMRGTDNNQSIVLIDGIKVNSPYSQTPPAGALLISNVDRIEIVKGPYSALYGSEAMGGVINVITSDEPGFNSIMQGGTYKTFNGMVHSSHRNEHMGYSIGYERFTTGGSSLSGPYWNNTLRGKVTIKDSSPLSLSLSTIYWNWQKYDYTLCCEINNNGKLAFVLDRNSRIRENNLLIAFQIDHVPRYFWNYNLGISFYTTKSQTINPMDPVIPERPFPLQVESTILADRGTFEMHHNFYHASNHVIAMGLTLTREWLKKEDYNNLDLLGMGPTIEQPSINVNRNLWALYVQDKYTDTGRGISITGGIRFENGPGYRDQFVYRLTALHHDLSGRNIAISYGEGIRAPSLNELYHPVGGNPDLIPEESSSLEFDLRQPFLGKKLWTNVSIYRLNMKNLIDWSKDSINIRYINTGKARIKGVEIDATLKPINNILITLGYHILSTKDLDTGEQLPMRPGYMWILDMKYKPISRFMININGQYVGRAFNPYYFIIGLDGQLLPERTPAYKIFNMAVAYTLIKKDPILGTIDFTLKLNNLFGEDYMEVPGFTGYGFNLLAGMRSTY